MSSIDQPEYNIWLREVTGDTLSSLRDPTQVRDSSYAPQNVTTGDPGTQTLALSPNDVTGSGTNRRQGSRLSRGFIYVGLVTNYEKLEFKTKYNDIGGWTLLMQDNTVEADILKNMCYGRQFPNDFTPAGFDGITVKRNGVLIFSGPVKGFEATGDFYSEHGPMIQFWGTDDNSCLNERIVCPRSLPTTGATTVVPLNNNPPYSGNTYTGKPDLLSRAGSEYIIPPASGQACGQGSGTFTYPETETTIRRVGAVLRETARFQIGLYTSYKNTYPSGQIIPTATIPPVYAGAPIFPYPNFGYITNRRVPFLFFGRTNVLNNIYQNNNNSNNTNPDQENITGTAIPVPGYRVSARFKNLLKTLQEIGAYKNFDVPQYRGYQFFVAQDENILVPELFYTPAPDYEFLAEQPVLINGLRFEYRQPRFTENTIFFSEKLGNISSYKYNYSNATGTVGVIAGQGEGLLRYFLQSSISNWTKFGHKEFFKDRRDIQYGDAGGTGVGQPPNTLPWRPGTPAQSQNYTSMRDALIGAINVSFREKDQIQDLEIETLNISPTIYHSDYFVGDFVTVNLASAAIVGQVLDVTVTLTKAEGEIVKATIGNNVIGSNTFLFDNIRRNTDEIEILEGSP